MNDSLRTGEVNIWDSRRKGGMDGSNYTSYSSTSNHHQSIKAVKYQMQLTQICALMATPAG